MSTLGILGIPITLPAGWLGMTRAQQEQTLREYPAKKKLLAQLEQMAVNLQWDIADTTDAALVGRVKPLLDDAFAVINQGKAASAEMDALIAAALDQAIRDGKISAQQRTDAGLGAIPIGLAILAVVGVLGAVLPSTYWALNLIFAERSARAQAILMQARAQIAAVEAGKPAPEFPDPHKNDKPDNWPWALSLAAAALIGLVMFAPRRGKGGE